MCEQPELIKLLLDRAVFKEHNEAVFQIRRGRVHIDGKRVYDPDVRVNPDSSVKVITSDKRFVSRGGLKLEHAINSFKIDIEGKTSIDIGASTGGFTDCLLAYGAEKVYAVDVGYGILDWELRNHPRVVVMERTNARYLNEEVIPDKASIITVDVNHISAVTIIQNVIPLLGEDGRLVVLVKPQFEIPKHLCKEPDFHRGVVTNDGLLGNIVQTTIDSIVSLDLYCSDPIESPIRGTNGNREFFVIAGTKQH